MLSFKILAAALLAGGALLAAAAFAQGTGRWTIGTLMPSARTEVAVAEVGGKIYVVGGFGGERELEVYDPAADRWSRGASIPRALHHAAAVGLNDKLYVIGGFVEGWTPTDDVHESLRLSDRADGTSPILEPVSATHTRLIPSEIKKEVWKQDGGRCVICGKTKNLHFGHDLPFSKGGTSISARNVRLLCMKHNLQKSGKIE
jgi:N-acetylneuraminic acid mutarotase